ncbi:MULTISPECIES: ribonuclease P protein component [unclassified Adlercreutzia]|uniref:ribonuclease P protein component n=1 Tax=unclassified Adlercreutzia TaxID=2636013 RepID=UPI0013ECFC2C|nr:MULTISPECIES: ribonuclease P protein component [unclassified Adlercreutzia]
MDTIKSSAEISDLFASGRRVKGSYLTLIVRSRVVGDTTEGVKQHGRNGRVAFIAGKKLGNAVWRNAAKRRMRAICRDLGGPWAGYDVIFLAKSSLTVASYSKVLKACDKMLGNSPLGDGIASDG